MKIIQAALPELELIKTITRNTINEIYPHYYPRGAVDFFLSHHNTDGIRKDIETGSVFLLYNQEQIAVGTVTVKENEICRLFVLPEHQNQGFGRRLLDFTEKKISEHYKTILLDASLPAKAVYLKKGYLVLESHTIKTGSGDFLCYDVMQKNLS